MKTVTEKAINIAIDTFLYEYAGNAVDVYTKLKDETIEHWVDIEYATVWAQFEDMCVYDVALAITNLVDDIVEEFS